MTDMPADVRDRIAAFAEAITASPIPKKSASNALIATWNLRAFGGVTPKWHSAAKDSPKRDWTAIAHIAELIRPFDVVAVQEVKRDTTALRFLLQQLGPAWRFITSDVTEGDGGNDERLAYLYDSKRVQASGLVGEIVLPPMANPSRQFARSPYAASFTRGTTEFILTTVHVIWGGNVGERLPEIIDFANWMRKWADRPNDWNQNLLVLGDFNIDRRNGALYQAFQSTGLKPPAALFDIPRTIFANDKDDNFYDQISWFTDQNAATPRTLLPSMGYTGRAGSFDFVDHFPGLTKAELSWRISDHYPLWVEFTI